MKADFTPLLVGLIIYLASIISIRFGISVAIVEILAGTIAGNLGLHPQEWMTYLAGFGGIILTFLAGAEIDTRLMREKFKESFLIGFFSFLMPFLGTFAYTFWGLHWSYSASLIAGTALSTTSLAVVYSVLVETGLCSTELGKTIMAATFITDMGTALALSILFIKPGVYTALFLAVSVAAIILTDRFSLLLLRSRYFANKVIEPEIKLIFLVLLAFIFFANLGESHAVLPAFVMGLVISKHFKGAQEDEARQKQTANRCLHHDHAAVLHSWRNEDIHSADSVGSRALCRAFSNQDGYQISGCLFPGQKVYSGRQHIYDTADEHRAYVWNHIKPVWLQFGLHQSGSVFCAGGGRSGQRGHPDVHCAEMVHARQ